MKVAEPDEVEELETPSRHAVVCTQRIVYRASIPSSFSLRMQQIRIPIVDVPSRLLLATQNRQTIKTSTAPDSTDVLSPKIDS